MIVVVTLLFFSLFSVFHLRKLSPELQCSLIISNQKCGVVCTHQHLPSTHSILFFEHFNLLKNLSSVNSGFLLRSDR